MVTAGVSLITDIGGPLSVLLQEYIPTTLNKRRDEALRRLEEDLKKIERKIDQQKFQSESFHITLIKTLRLIVIERHQEKLEAFRGITLNEAITPSENPELDLFLAVTDTLTGDHIRMLKIFADPSKFVAADPKLVRHFKDISMGGIGEILKPAFPMLNREHFESMMDDLHQKSLSKVRRDGLGTTISKQGILEKKTTELGDRYIKFISLPNEIQTLK